MALIDEIKKNNFYTALKEITFTMPFFRRAFGQYPYEVEVITFRKKKLGKRIKETISKKKSPFVAIVRDKEERIIDIFLVPIEKHGDGFKVIGVCNELISSPRENTTKSNENNLLY